MEKRQLGRTGMDVTALGFGGAEIGFENASIETVDRLLGEALDAGLNVVDTAECYMGSEELVGRAASHRRDEFYLFTKCGHPDGDPDWRPESLVRSIERSLERLRTDRLDLVQLHSCDLDELRKGDVVDALRTARDRGLTRFVGYSGDGQAARYAIESGEFDTLQTSVSVADQEALDLTLPLARERQIGVIAKRPVANAAWRTGRKPESEYHHEYWERLNALEYDFLRDELPSAIATALRFTLSVPGVHTAIVGTTKPGRWAENARLLEGGPLDPTEFERIRARWREVASPDWVGQT